MTITKIRTGHNLLTLCSTNSNKVLCKFNLYAKNDVSSFTLPMLLKYRKIVKKDEEKMRTFNMLVTSRRQKLISERERENSNAYVKTTNQY